MNSFLVICLIAAMIATVVALVRGVVQFLKTSHEDLAGTGPNLSGERQNRMMRLRIFFQALAVLAIILLLMLRQSGG
jgi:hypothetical protein